MLNLIGPIPLWPHALTVRYADDGTAWGVACRQCLGLGVDEEPEEFVLLDTPENRDAVRGTDPDDYEMVALSEIVAVTARHLENLSEHFPPFDPEHVKQCGAIAALADDPLPGIAALIEGRTDCTVSQESLF